MSTVPPPSPPVWMGRFRSFADGVAAFEIPTWLAFNTWVANGMVDFANYVYRGQTRSEWLLEPSLDRVLKGAGRLHDPIARAGHLEAFKFASRGRRGPHPAPLLTENDWWALGQHHGLATPLLDWTLSPYAAAFFAFADADPSTAARAIFALQTDGMEGKTEGIVKGFQGSGRPPIVEIVRPLSDENARLVNQAGLFTRGPDGIDLESWIREQYRGDETRWRLVKLELPNGEREVFLKNLNRMNINHLSLFPDLLGSSLFANMDLSIRRYSHYW